MIDEQAVFPPLAGAFAPVYQRVKDAPTGETGRVLALFAYSLAEGEAFDLSRIERLPRAERELCLALFGYCLNAGLSEDERRAAAEAFAPFAAMHAPGARH
ncbi:MAG: hypothetical protein LBI87_10980 [Candidatus Accumulibacter sp.]|jgi:hypothetical protein|nr:hypothetical protein [Accumulibacter sp.]